MSKCSKNRELLWEEWETAFHEKGPLEISGGTRQTRRSPNLYPPHEFTPNRFYPRLILHVNSRNDPHSFEPLLGLCDRYAFFPRDSASNQIKPDPSRPRNEMAAGRQITQYILRNIRDYRRLKLPVYSPRVVFSFQASPSRPSLFTLWRTVRWTPLRRSRTARLSVSVCKSALGTLRTALWGTRISPST
jgi:hypothetical protein